MAAGWCGCPCLWETDCLCRHLRPLATHPGCTLSCCLPPSWLIFSSHGNSSRHRRTMTVMTRPSVHPDRAWCITPSPLNSPTFTIPILLLKKSRVWEPEKLSSNHESMPWWHGTSQNHHPCQALGTSPLLALPDMSGLLCTPSFTSLSGDLALRGSNQLSLFPTGGTGPHDCLAA